MREQEMRVGFCGLGLMGARMARRLLAAGHQVHVWNRTASKADELARAGAIAARTPRELAEQCVTVLMCLFDAEAVQDVVFGEQGLAQGSALRTVVDHSSIPPDRTQDMARRLSRETAAVWIDAPVSGGVQGAEEGTLAVMAGGPVAGIEAVTPLLAAYASRVTRMGDVGAGQVTKLCNQTIVATTLAAIGEAVALARANGVDAARLDEALAGGWADSTLLRIFVPRMTQDQGDKIASLNTMLKDLDTVAGLAQTGRTPIPVSSAAQQSYRLAGSMGLGEFDVSRLVEIYLGDGKTGDA